MTVAALPSTVSYIEDGASTSFPVPFRFKAASDLIVERLVGGASTVLQLGTDYAVTGGETDAGGTLTRTIATVGAELRISRRTARAQAMVYNANDRFPAKSHEGALDQQMLIAQEQDASIQDIDARALMLPPGERAPTLPSAATRAGGVLVFDPQTGAAVVKPEALLAPGATGPSNNTRVSLADLKAASITDLTSLYAGALWTFTVGDYSGVSPAQIDVSVVQANGVPLSSGAWIRQRSADQQAKRDAIAAIPRSAQAEFDDAVKITQFGAVGGNKALDTAGLLAAIQHAWTRGRTVCIPDSDVPFQFGKIIMPANEIGMDGDSARPTRFAIVGTGAFHFAESGFLFDAPAGRYFYDLVIGGGLRASSVSGAGSKFINGDKFIRLTLSPGLNLRNFDWGVFGSVYLQTVRANAVTHRGGTGAFIKTPMAYDCSITDNIVEFGNDGIVIDGNGDPAVHTCRFDGNVIEGMGGRGIVTGVCLSTTIVGNYMEGNAGGEIFLDKGTAAHKGLIVQANSLQQSEARKAAGARSIVWGASLALPALSGGNFSTGHLHDLTGSAGLLFTIGDNVPAGKQLTPTGVGRAIITDDFSLITKWFDRSMWLDPYQGEVVFQGKYDSQGAPVVVTFGTNSPSNTPAAFERTAWARGSVVHNVNAAAPGDVTFWVCTATGTPGSWRAGGVIPT